jgi:TonB family protein
MGYRAGSSLTVLAISIGLLISLVSISCQSTANTKPADIDNSVHCDDNSHYLGNRNSEDEEAPCLRVDAPKPKFMVSFGVINSKAIEIPKPEYPEAAKAAKISGEVQVAVIVGQKGDIIWARVKTGHPILEAAVKKVVCQVRFKPNMVSGRPMAVHGIINYKFVLQ